MGRTKPEKASRKAEKKKHLDPYDEEVGDLHRKVFDIKTKVMDSIGAEMLESEVQILQDIHEIVLEKYQKLMETDIHTAVRYGLIKERIDIILKWWKEKRIDFLKKIEETEKALDEKEGQLVVDSENQERKAAESKMTRYVSWRDRYHKPFLTRNEKREELLKEDDHQNFTHL